MADVLDRSARQVRLPGGAVHKLTGATSDRIDGRRYWTRCGELLIAAEGAILTTRDVGCTACRANRLGGAQEFVSAVLGGLANG